MKSRIQSYLMSVVLMFAVIGAYAQTADTTHYEMAKTPVTTESYFLKHFAYMLGFNPSWNVPNWVGWQLTAEHAQAKNAGRSNNFRPDPDMPCSPTSNDYKKSGYDRGHMAPAADMAWSAQAMNECFYMTNMCPQLHGLNGFDWMYLETREREWAVRFGLVYICCGPIVDKPERCQRIGTNQVLVPKRFFKVILAKANGEWQAIGFVMMQDDENRQKSDLSQFVCPVDDIERLTGIDFFYKLPDDVENRIESSCNFNQWK